LTKDKKPYGPIRFNQISRECQFISENCHTSYTDVLKITPHERKYMLINIAEKLKKSEEQLAKLKAEQEAKKKK